MDILNSFMLIKYFCNLEFTFLFLLFYAFSYAFYVSYKTKLKGEAILITYVLVLYRMVLNYVFNQLFIFFCQIVTINSKLVSIFINLKP